ncbi:hypothetical protein GCM10017779_68710 [Streptomyces capillispiralis]|uniref:Putative DNA primase/helicase n=1 Tax=Streptomyces capillispiralis TaxID=68182 RepID=A0A561SGU0_9ACTN|nr:putative DNA primase/helicase [Streptomyces capillispiralis]GHH96414.1 hypothetical protein GCM10017779_68710 [Streptomyces capillispiralis]
MAADSAAGAASVSGTLRPVTLTDRGNAQLFATRHRRRFRHVRGLGWFAWDRTHWRQSGAREAALWAAGEMAEDIVERDPLGAFSPEELAEHKRYSLSTYGLRALLAQASAAPTLMVAPGALDAEPYELCTPAGVVDLRTGALRAAEPLTDLHSRVTAVAPDLRGTPRWHQFLDDAFGSDPDGRATISYVQLMLGYSITGLVGARVLPFLHGPGNNGKSVLETVMRVLGDYADAASPGFLMERGHGSNRCMEAAELRGRRLIVCSEIRANDRIDEAEVRALTDGSRLTGRRIRTECFSFTPTHHLWLLGDHTPEAAVGGPAFLRRMRLIPTQRTVAPALGNDHLVEDLVEHEGAGIIQWLIEGARRYLASQPARVFAARVRQEAGLPPAPR